MPRPSAEANLQVDNPRVKVTEWRFEPGAETGWHTHEYDYVICPVTAGRLLLENPDGEAESELAAGHTYFREKGVEHNVINASTEPLIFVEIELKEPLYQS